MADQEPADDERRAALLRIARYFADAEPLLSEEEETALVAQWNRLCPHPGASNIIFWPNELGLCRADELSTFDMPAEQMVDFAMSWEPRVVAMQVQERSGGKRYYLYKLVAPGTPVTQVATSSDEDYAEGAVLAVALKGVRLRDGSRVGTVFDLAAMSCGRILGSTSEPVGTRIVGHPSAA